MSVGYDPTLIGLDEARLNAYQALIITNLGTLNTALNRDTLTPLGAVTAAMVEIGDPQTLWELPTGAVRIRIVGGEASGTPNMEAEVTTVLNKNVGWVYTFVTVIRVYLHPDALANLDGSVQATSREIALARIHDWFVLGVANYWDPVGLAGGVVVNLETNIVTPTSTGKTDYLLDAWVRETRKPMVDKGFGNTRALRCVEFELHGTIG